MYNSAQAAPAFFFKDLLFFFQINMSELFHVCAYDICMGKAVPACEAVRGQVWGQFSPSAVSSGAGLGLLGLCSRQHPRPLSYLVSPT